MGWRFRAMLAMLMLLAACEEPAPSYISTYSPPYVPPAPQRDYGAASNRLQPHMTEAQVTEILGGEPFSTQLLTCGSATGRPWSCRTASYGRLQVRYYWNADRRAWLVNSWDFS